VSNLYSALTVTTSNALDVLVKRKVKAYVSTCLHVTAEFAKQFVIVESFTLVGDDSRHRSQ